MEKWCLILASKSFMTGSRAAAGLRAFKNSDEAELMFGGFMDEVIT
jgi:hypothetical protein